MPEELTSDNVDRIICDAKDKTGILFCHISSGASEIMNAAIRLAYAAGYEAGHAAPKAPAAPPVMADGRVKLTAKQREFLWHVSRSSAGRIEGFDWVVAIKDGKTASLHPSQSGRMAKAGLVKIACSIDSYRARKYTMTITGAGREWLEHEENDE